MNDAAAVTKALRLALQTLIAKAKGPAQLPTPAEGNAALWVTNWKKNGPEATRARLH